MYTYYDASKEDTCLNTLFSVSPLLQGETGSPEDRCHGELLLDLEGGKMFSVAQHQNNPHLSFLCLESRRVELYHKGEWNDCVISGFSSGSTFLITCSSVTIHVFSCRLFLAMS